MSKELENLICGLRHYTRVTEEATKDSKTIQLVELHSNIGILIYRAVNLGLIHEIVYPAQALQNNILDILKCKGILK